MAKQVYSVRALWDTEASVWVSESDIPGLVIETGTLAEFEQCMREFAPELLKANLGVDTPVSIQFSASRELDLVG